MDRFYQIYAMAVPRVAFLAQNFTSTYCVEKYFQIRSALILFTLRYVVKIGIYCR